MTTTSTLFPGILAPEPWIEFCLKSGKEEWQTAALEEIRKYGLNPLLKAMLQDFSRQALPAPLQTIIQQLFAAEEAKNRIIQLAQTEFTPETATSFLQEFQELLHIDIPRLIRKAPAPEVLESWRNGLGSDIDPGVQQLGLILLARFGMPSDGRLALPFLESDHPAVVRAAIDLLHARDEETFKVSVATVLRSPDLQLRFHAVRRLGTIDPTEALAFLKPHLESPNPQIRQRALPELMLFPFDVTESALLAFLGQETNPLLLVLAATAVSLNPHRQLPLRIYDMFLLSRGLKAHILHLALDSTIKTIRAAGLLTEPPERYIATLKTQLDHRRHTLTVRFGLQKLAHPDPDVRGQAIRTLSGFLSWKAVEQALSAHLEKESDPFLQESLGELLGRKPISQATLDTLFDSLQSGGFFDLQPGHQQKLLGTITTSDGFSRVKKGLMALVPAQLPRTVTIFLLEILERFGSPMDAVLLEPLLKHADPGIVSAAIRTIGHLNIEGLLLQFQQLLQREDPRIRTAAIEVLIITDKEAALQQVKSMIKSGSTDLRKIACSILGLLDYASAEPLLFFLLETEKTEEILLQAGFLVATNPSVSGIKMLYNICHRSDGKPDPSRAELWNSALESAELILEQSRQALVEAAMAEHQAERTRREAVPKAYAYATVKPLELADAPEPATTTELLHEMFIKKPANLVLTVLIFGLPIFFLLTAQTGPQPNVPGKSPTQDANFRRMVPLNAPSSGAGQRPGSVAGAGKPHRQSSGGSFDRAVSGAAEIGAERRQRIKESQEQYLQTIINNTQLSLPERLSAAALLDNGFQNALNLTRSRRYDAAKPALLEVLQNSTNPLVRAKACECLMEIALQAKSTDEFVRWLEAFYQESAHVAMDGNQAAAKKMLELTGGFKAMLNQAQQLKNPVELMKFKQSLAKCDTIPEEARTTALTSLQEVNTLLPSSGPGGTP
jgi:HEAT repeat protein